MSFIQRVLFVFLAIFFVTGCHRITYQVATGSGAVEHDTRWREYFIFGIAPERDRYSLSELCRGEQVLEVQSLHTPSNLLSGLLSLGLTSGGTLESTCSKSSVSANDR